MLQEPAIKKIIRLRFRRMNKLYQRIRDTYDKEAIHHFRVEYKKLRAFLRLLAVNDEQAKLKIPGSLRDIYQKAGTVRDLQLHIEAIQTNESFSGFPAGHLQRWKRKLAGAKKQLDKEMQDDVLTASQRKIDKKIKGGLEDSITENFVSAKMSGISRLLAHKVIRDTDLHSVRKNLKDIVYIALAFKKDLSMPLPVTNWTAGKEKYFTKVAGELGSFQDNCISLTHLKEDLKIITSGMGTKLIKKVHLEHSRLKRQQKKSLKEKLNATNYFPSPPAVSAR